MSWIELDTLFIAIAVLLGSIFTHTILSMVMPSVIAGALVFAIAFLLGWGLILKQPS